MEINLLEYQSLPTSPGIYHVSNSRNGNFYVGSAKNLRKRIRDHCKGVRSNPHLQNAITKYGKDSFTVRVEICDTLSSYGELLAKEQECLDKYFEECWDRTYNISNKAGGGDIISCLSEERQKEIKRKISEAGVGRKHSEDTKQKLSEAKKGENHHFFGKTGENNPNFGKQLSKDTKHKISEALKGREFSEETKQKISEAHKGKELSEETREKLSKANKDKKLSDKHRQKISEAGMGRKHSEDT